MDHRRIATPLLLVLVLVFGSAAWAQPAAPAAPAAPRHITIASYNAENFFDVFDDPYTRDEQNEVKPRAQIERLAATLRALNADVVALQEVENEGVLRAMTREFLDDLRYDFVAVLPTNSDRGINIGVLSRVPIESITSHRYLDLTLPEDPRTWRFARDLLRVRLRVGDARSLDLFVVHFKSKAFTAGDPKSAAWRLAEATATRRIVDHLIHVDPQAWVLLAGDLNDTPETATLRAMLDTQPSDDDTRPHLVDVHVALPPDRRISYLKPPYRSTIDYLLASPALAARVVPGSPRTLSDGDTHGSDHAPIVATFDLSE